MGATFVFLIWYLFNRREKKKGMILGNTMLGGWNVLEMECSSICYSIGPSRCWCRFDSMVWQGIFFPGSTFSADSHSVSVYPHVQLLALTSVRMVKIMYSVSQFGGLWQHKHTQHAPWATDIINLMILVTQRKKMDGVMVSKPCWFL